MVLYLDFRVKLILTFIYLLSYVFPFCYREIILPSFLFLVLFAQAENFWRC